jgi:RNA polymerase sigma factor (sigma-70 family)
MHCECCAQEISRRIGHRLNRSPLTILHTIRKFDQENPDQAIFASAIKPVDEETRGRILKAYRKGVTIRDLAHRSSRPRTAIYRIILEERLRKINRRKTQFIDDPLYHQPDAANAIETIVMQEDLGDRRKPEDHRVPRDIPPYLQNLYRVPLLSAARERALFLKLNFHRYQFVQARRRLDPQFVRSRDLNVLEGHLRQASETKNAIVSANLRLIVSVARKHMRPGLNLMELISDGNLTLIRAVDSFDIHKGNRFSTYATLSLMKGFARSVSVMLSTRKAGSWSDDLALNNIVDTRVGESTSQMLIRDELRQLLSNLDDRERRVLVAHYGIGAAGGPSTLAQVGDMLGLSKQRVRQIEQSALAKLRDVTSPTAG